MLKQNQAKATVFPFTKDAPYVSKQRSCGWCFTQFMPSVEDIEHWHFGECKFVIYGKEKTKEGRYHLQGYIFFESPGKTFFAVLRLLPHAHWSQSKGRIQENIDYCSKQGDVYHRGKCLAFSTL